MIHKYLAIIVYWSLVIIGKCYLWSQTVSWSQIVSRTSAYINKFKKGSNKSEKATVFSTDDKITVIVFYSCIYIFHITVL